MPLFRGARDLGLKVEWRYRFLGQDETASTAPGVLYIELGGKVAPGVLDHHHGQERDTCAAEVVLRNRDLVYGHLLGPWLARDEIRPGTAWTPTIVTHRQPDWDSVVATYLVTRLIEDGEFPPEGEALARYARLVDQGLLPLFAPGEELDWDGGLLSERPELFAPHLGFLAMQNVDSLRGDDERLQLGLELLKRVVDDLQRSGRNVRRMKPDDFRPTSATGGRSHPAALWTQDERFREAVDLLSKDAWAYLDDRVHRSELHSTVLLPAEDGDDPIEVRVFALTEEPASKLNKYWVRAEGYPFFVCPYRKSRPETPGGGPDGLVYQRVVLSLDPGFRAPDGRRPSLRGLGFRLELEETRVRTQRGRGDDRGLPRRFPEPYCTNADPWYDGRGHDYTIVDSPMAGTVLPYDTVVRIACRDRFWELPLEAGTAVVVKAPQPEEDGAPPPEATPLGVVDGWAPPMTIYRQDVADWPRSSGAGGTAHQALEQRHFRRWLPGGAARAFDVTLVSAGPSASLDALVAAVGPTRDRVNAHLFVRLRVDPRFVGDHFLAPSRLRALLRQLDIDLPLSAEVARKDLVGFGGQTLCLEPAVSEPSTADGPDADVETFLYSVYLAESLTSFSAQIAQRLPGRDHEPEEARDLRVRFVEFQTRYYQLDISRTARGRSLSSWLSRLLRLPEHYEEVRSELDRLNELEERESDNRRRRAEGILGTLLFFMAAFGVVQTLMGFWNHPSSLLERIGLCAAVGLVVGGAWLQARRKLRSATRPSGGDR